MSARVCKQKGCNALLSVYNPGDICGLHERNDQGFLIDHRNDPAKQDVLRERERRIVRHQVRERELHRAPANPFLTGDEDDREDARSRWMSETDLCSLCLKEPRYVGKLGKRCYDKRWRKTQGAGSKYRQGYRERNAARAS